MGNIRLKQNSRSFKKNISDLNKSNSLFELVKNDTAPPATIAANDVFAKS